MNRRHLFAEIAEGFEALRQARQGDAIRLSPEEQAAFVTALLNPPPISERLRQAAKQYRQSVDATIQAR